MVIAENTLKNSNALHTTKIVADKLCQGQRQHGGPFQALPGQVQQQVARPLGTFSAVLDRLPCALLGGSLKYLLEELFCDPAQCPDIFFPRHLRLCLG